MDGPDLLHDLSETLVNNNKEITSIEERFRMTALQLDEPDVKFHPPWQTFKIMSFAWRSKNENVFCQRYCKKGSVFFKTMLRFNPMVTLRIPPLLIDFPDIEGGVSLDILICIVFLQ